MSHTVIGIFDSYNEAQNAVEQLKRNGFVIKDIDVSSHEDSDSVSATRTENRDSGDSISDFFTNLFGGSDESNTYSNVAKSRNVVTVHTRSASDAERASAILDQYGAVDVNEKAMQLRSGSRDMENRQGRSDTSIPIIEEQMNVGKRVVETGGVRLRSRIIERPVEEHSRLRTEHVNVERRAVNRPATDADFNAFKEGEMEITERAEVPVVNKEARVVEEVNLNTEVEEKEETIRDTVRKTDVDVNEIKRDDSIRRDEPIRRDQSQTQRNRENEKRNL